MTISLSNLENCRLGNNTGCFILFYVNSSQPTRMSARGEHKGHLKYHYSYQWPRELWIRQKYWFVFYCFYMSSFPTFPERDAKGSFKRPGVSLFVSIILETMKFPLISVVFVYFYDTLSHTHGC